MTDLGTVTGDTGDPPLTEHHEVVGTPYYRAPESQYGRYDERSDVFSLGRILAWMLTGVEPDRPSPPPIPDTSPLTEAAREALNLVIRTACAPEPGDRYASVDRLRDALPSLVGAVVPRMATSPHETQGAARTYRHVKETLRRGDTMGWQDLRKGQRAETRQALAAWREEAKGRSLSSSSLERRKESLDGALIALGHPLAFALASLEAPGVSDDDVFRILDDILNSPVWAGGSMVLLVRDAPLSLVSVVHSLLGASLAMLNRPESIVRLARLRLARENEGRDPEELWRAHRLLWSMPFLEDEPRTSWTFLRTLPARHPWLEDAYGSLPDFQICLSAYWWTLSTIELASGTTHRRSDLQTLRPDQFRLRVVPLMLLEPDDIHLRGFRQVLGASRGLRRIADEMGVAEEQIRHAWPYWKEALAHYACHFLRPSGSFAFPEEIRIPDP